MENIPTFLQTRSIQHDIYRPLREPVKGGFGINLSVK